MTEQLRIPDLAVIGATIAAGVAATLAALAGRGADAQFLQDQRHPPSLRAVEVNPVVSSAPDPASGKGRGTAADCVRHGSGPLGNPWTCVVTYPSGKRVRLSVRIAQDGTYVGSYRGAGGGATSGCCIDLPGTR